MSEIDAGDKNAAGASGILIGAETVVKAQEAAAKLKDKANGTASAAAVKQGLLGKMKSKLQSALGKQAGTVLGKKLNGMVGKAVNKAVNKALFNQFFPLKLLNILALV